MTKDEATNAYAPLVKDAKRQAGVVGIIVGILIMFTLMWRGFKVVGLIPSAPEPTTETTTVDNQDNVDPELKELRAQAEQAKARAEQAKARAEQARRDLEAEKRSR